MITQHKLIRITTVPISLKTLLRGQSKFMSSHYEVVGISSNGKELLEVQTDEGIRVLSVNMTRTISPLQDLKSLLNLYKIFRQEKPFIVHSHTPKAGIVGMLAAKFAGVPHRLHTVAGLPLMEATGNKRKLLNFVEKLTYKCSTKVYPNSKGLYNFIVENKFAQENKLKVLANGSSNGIDTNHFDAKLFSNQEKKILSDSLGIKNDDFVFIFVGRLVSDKGINELVQAFDALKKGFKKAKLLLVGALESDLDPLQEITLKRIQAKNSNIILAGFQQDVRPYFVIANVLVFPSYREGFPNVVMQAGSMGLPCIVSNINGCNEIIEEGVNGTIIPVKDKNALYQSMYKIVNDRELMQFLGGNSREMIVSRYEQKVVWNAILEEYKIIEKNV